MSDERLEALHASPRCKFADIERALNHEHPCPSRNETALVALRGPAVSFAVARLLLRPRRSGPSLAEDLGLLLRRPPTRRLLGTDDVAQDPHARHLELDLVARRELAAELQCRAARRGPRADDVAGVQLVALLDVGHELARRPDHRAARSARPLLAVDPRDHLERADVELVDRRHPRPKRTGEVLGLRRAQPEPHLRRLDVAGAEVVEDRHTE